MVRKATIKDYLRLIEIWKSSVKATHYFLAKEDFEDIKSKLSTYFDHVSLFVYEDFQSGNIKGFIGIAEDKIEMLFIEDSSRGEGIGKILINYALKELNAHQVDVNEQNHQAVGFYEHLGFEKIGRSEKDSEGKDYPILHLQKL